MDKKNAFTIVELIVAMSLLVLLVGLSSVVFSTTVRAHRKATATIEITRNLRVLSEQLNADFGGLRKDMPIFFHFDPQLNVTEPRFDMVHFFADGDFQTSKQYDYDNDGNGTPEGVKTVVGNVARVYYGHANSLLVDLSDPQKQPDFETYQVLSRKCHILTADSGILNVYGQIPLISNWPTTPTVTDYTLFADPVTGFGVSYVAGDNTYLDENELEFNTISPTQWSYALNYPDGGVNAEHFITCCMTDAYRPFIDLADYTTLHLMMAQGVMDFAVQWAYTSDDLVGGSTFEGVRWWPSADPAGDESAPSDFAMMNSGNPFGVYFALPNGETFADWYTIGQCRNGFSGTFSDTFYPKALKFTFTLKDANGVFPDGRTFTHIVYLDD